ncbi:MAG: plasmid recombination protein [Oscillospiraceae bacterium]|nr:plasmid recombination protein [Oscillospiraceae bacterium]
MASLICLVTKNKLPDLIEIQAHNQREGLADSLVIFPERTHLNYRLHDVAGVELKYEAEYRGVLKKYYSGQKAVRKDATVLCSLFVSSNKSFFEVKEESEVRRFFECNYNFLKNYFGEHKVVDAVVHMDERVPHMHFCFVPITKDGRLSAREICDRRGLTLLHAKALASIRECGFDITKSDDTYSPLKMAEDLKRNILIKEVQKLEEKFADCKNIDKSIKSIDEIPFKRSKMPFRDEMVSLTDENFAKIRNVARFGVTVQGEFDRLARENERLRNRYNDHVVLINELRVQIAEISKNRDELLREGMEMLKVIKSHNGLNELYNYVKNALEAKKTRR